MKKKIALLLVGVMALSTIFLGCEKKVTAESLIEEMNAKMENAKSYEANMDMDMSMNISSEGIGMDMDMSMDGAIQATMEPAITYMDVTMEMSMLGLSMDMEVYTQIEEDQVVAYTGMAGQWVKAVQPMAEGMETNNLSINVGDPANLTLAEETPTLAGGDAYVLSGTVSGAELQEVMGSMDSMMEGMGDMDLSGLQADMTLWIYKETGYPASMEVVMAGDGLSAEADGVTTTISSISVVMDYTGFDAIDAIEIPAEALAAETVDTTGLTTE